MTISGTQIATQRSTSVEELVPLLNDARPVLGVMNFNIIDQLIEQLREAYPAEWIMHAVAVNSMGLPGVLEHFRARGLGAVTASASELDIAKHSGFMAHELVHSAAVNTWSILRQLMETGLSLSVDNFAELNRIDELVEQTEHVQPYLGLCVTSQAPIDDENPAHTHRGIGLRDHHQDILQAYLDRPWLDQVHLNFATPPATLQDAAEHVVAIYQLAEDLEHAAGSQRIQRIQMTGGLPVNFASDDVAPSISNHRFALQTTVPELFDGKYTIVTEFTDALTAKAGMILARVEYVKDIENKLIAVIHVETPLPRDQGLRFEAYDDAGERKDTSELFYYDVTGPTGMIGHRIQLPEIEEGDILAILDVGATAFGPASTFSAPVYGIRADGLLTETSVLRHGHTVDDVVHAAGVYQPAKLLH